jgi:transposase
MTLPYQLYVGVAIEAKTFTATWSRNAGAADVSATFDQTTEGIATFQRRLSATGIAPAASLLIVEARNSFCVRLAVQLHPAGYAVSVLFPRQLALYRSSQSQTAISAEGKPQTLMRFAIERRPLCWTPPRADYYTLRQHLVIRDDLVLMRSQLSRRRSAMQRRPTQNSSVVIALDTMVMTLTSQIRALDSDITQLLLEGAWADSARLLLNIPGLGPITTAWLLVETLNFSLATSAAQLVAYVELAPPRPGEEETQVDKMEQIGFHDNGRVRIALYEAAVCAIREEPTIRAFARRLRAAGKPRLVVRRAAARKLLHLAWALVKPQQPRHTPDATQLE